jgi:hypothetical protein
MVLIAFLVKAAQVFGLPIDLAMSINRIAPEFDQLGYFGFAHLSGDRKETFGERCMK